MTELQTLIGLQDYDTRIGSLESEAARLPREIQALHAALDEARHALDVLRARLEASRKELRARERDLDDVGVKRAKSEARLYEVKTNIEYSAVLVEIETIKTQKAKTEEEILALMERQEGLAVEIRDAEARYASREAQVKREEATIRQRLAAVEQQLEGVRAERASLAREVPRNILGDYERILKARGGLGLAVVTSTSVWCAGCRVSIRPQAVQELRSGQVLLHCESCGRFLYWRD